MPRALATGKLHRRRSVHKGKDVFFLKEQAFRSSHLQGHHCLSIFLPPFPAVFQPFGPSFNSFQKLLRIISVSIRNVPTRFGLSECRSDKGEYCSHFKCALNADSTQCATRLRSNLETNIFSHGGMFFLTHERTFQSKVLKPNTTIILPVGERLGRWVHYEVNP